MKKIFSLTTTLLIFISSFTQAQILNSDTTAAPVIFLDFDGHTVSGTSWNYNGPIVCGASGLSAAQIQEVFSRVAEDYRPFTVNVTTDSTKFLAAPILQRIRVLVTVSSAWFGNAGGVSYVSSFSWGDDTPCFVFSQLLAFNVKNISEAISHEAGHTLGLFHQSTYDGNCNKVSDYNTGTGNGEIGWAPIMGVGYYRNLTLWHTGPNTFGCTNIQDDIEVITNGANGITLKTDSIGNTMASSKVLTVNNNNFSATGIIEHSNDADLFKLIVPTKSTLSFIAAPLNVGIANAGANIDVQTDLYTNTMTMLKTNNPVESLNASLDTTLNAGTYYIRIKPVANINSSTYGMVGEYAISGTVIGFTTLPLYKFELKGKVVNQQHQLNWVIEADEAISELIVEYSANGSSFAALHNALTTDTKFSYMPANGNKLFYRLKLILKTGEVHYSNTIYLNNTASKIPKVIANPVTHSTLLVDGSNDYTFTIYSIDGRKIQTGKLEDGTNSINIKSEKSGLHLVSFDNGKGSLTSQKILFQ